MSRQLVHLSCNGGGCSPVVETRRVLRANDQVYNAQFKYAVSEIDGGGKFFREVEEGGVAE